jgi:hypothetical protein
MYSISRRVKQIEWHNMMYNELKYGKNVQYKEYVQGGRK